MNFIEEITKLKLLLDQGAITQDEFNLLKKKLLVEENKMETSSKCSENLSEDNSKEIDSTHHGNKTNMKINTGKAELNPKFSGTKKIIIPAIIVILLIYIFYPYKTWEKKQFDDYDDLVESFKYASYEKVKKEFGEPYYKFLDITTQQITYRWHGVGVKGHEDAYLNFDVLEYAPGFFMGFEFKTVQGYEGDYAPGNDNFYNID